MERIHTTDPMPGTKEKDAYFYKKASDDSQVDFIAALVKMAMRKTRKSAIPVEYLLSNKKVMQEAINQLFDIDPIELQKFSVKKFYKDVLLLNVETSLMNCVEVNGFPMFMYIPAQLSFEDVVERLRVKGNKVHLSDDQVKAGGGRLGYSTGYSFMFQSEHILKREVMRKDDLFDIHASLGPRNRIMNRMEYLICARYVRWFYGVKMSDQALLDYSPSPATLVAASMPISTSFKFDFLPIEKFTGPESFPSMYAHSLYVREIYLP